MNDIEIARRHKLNPIAEVAASCGIPFDRLELYGNYKAKLLPTESGKKGKLVLVTAINPTPLGEGKTTVSIGLADALKRRGKKSGLALREPSLGPVFGIKGGATGGGYAQVVPMDDINLHFTGDIAAITLANNLLSSMIDNHIFQGNELGIDPERVVWKRCVDLNDRALRHIQVGLEGPKNGVPRLDGFDITAASEVMAILCLARDLNDLKQRLGNILISYTYGGSPVYCRQLKAENAMAILLKDAIKPNLVQTLEGTPALIHGGPFANIAHGCNSIIATQAALSLFDYTVTEAGFGADLGAEKFLNVKCCLMGIKPDAVVIVASVKALKHNGGLPREQLSQPHLEALSAGICNLEKHIENVTQGFGLPCAVAINRFSTDTEEELDLVKQTCSRYGVKACVVTVWADGGAGGLELADEVARLCDIPSQVNFTYPLEAGIRDKIEAIVKKVYGGGRVAYSDEAKESIEKIEDMGYGGLPVIIAKSQYSLSADPKVLGRPRGFEFPIKSVCLRSGAGFVVACAGDIMLMPGLPKEPAAARMKIFGSPAGSYEIEGLF